MDIPVSEQIRLVESSGILHRLPPDFEHPRFEELDSTNDGASAARLSDGGGPRRRDAQRALDEAKRDGPSPLFEEMFDTLLYLIPFSFVYLLMDIMIRQQYAQHPTIMDELGRLAQAVPILSVFIFYTKRHVRRWVTQLALFALSIWCGCLMVYRVNKSPYHPVIRQCPPLGTLWVYAIVQLDLAPACISLAIVAAWVKWHDLHIIF